MDIAVRMQEYERHLLERGFARNTIDSYIWVAAFFERNYRQVNVSNLRAYRTWLVSTFKPNTANQRIQAMNCYLRFLGKEEHALRCARVQQKTYLENAITDEQYRKFANHLRKGGYMRDYCAVRVMATTGARVSELLGMEVSHMRNRYCDVASKGKIRRIHIPEATAREVLQWVMDQRRSSGPLFLNRFGEVITPRGLAQQFRVRAGECGIDGRLVHPHAFRHLFARCFLAAGGDIMFLADLMGHSSVETTRIYLQRTAEEQSAELNRLVNW